jgi:hypothetical protein
VEYGFVIVAADIAFGLVIAVSVEREPAWRKPGRTANSVGRRRGRGMPPKSESCTGPALFLADISHTTRDEVEAQPSRAAKAQ